MIRRNIFLCFTAFALISAVMVSDAAAQNSGDGNYVFTFLPNNGTEYQQFDVNNVDIGPRGIVTSNAPLGGAEINGVVKGKRIVARITTDFGDEYLISGRFVKTRGSVLVYGDYALFTFGTLNTTGRFFAEQVED